MRKPIIAGNWKMFKTRDEALQFIYNVNEELPSNELVDTVVCAPHTVLRCLVKRQGDNLRIGAQNMHFEDQGAFTGEVSAAMLTCIGVEYVIIGHSERRAMFCEDNETVNKKLHQAFKAGLTPILCVGEDLQNRENDETEIVIKEQLYLNLSGLAPEDVAELVIAYEPIWAIGTGKTATPEMANETCGFVRQTIAEMYSDEIANQVRIQYGGSVNTSNISDLMAQEHIDGALVGGASLIAKDFVTLAKAAIEEE